MRLHRSRVDTLEQNFEYGHVAVIAQTFDGDGAERADVARLRALLGGSTARVEAAIGAGAADGPVLPALREGLPGGGLRRGGGGGGGGPGGAAGGGRARPRSGAGARAAAA